MKAVTMTTRPTLSAEMRARLKRLKHTPVVQFGLEIGLTVGGFVLAKIGGKSLMGGLK